jgi:hypothetical protein
VCDVPVPFARRPSYPPEREDREDSDRTGDPISLGGMIMLHRRAVDVPALAIVLMLTMASAASAQDKTYPSWKGEWGAVFPRLPGQQLRFDPSKPFAQGQQAPLTEEYQKVYQDNLAEIAKGRQGLFLYHASCMPAGMPSMMSTGTFEFIVTPDTTYIVADTDIRRIFTDGRPWPDDMQPTYQGFSIGKWLDEDGDGVYDTLDVETRGPFKGPRTYDASGLPLHFDNESTFHERLSMDPKDKNVLHDVITVFDHALTRPWTADKSYRRRGKKFPNWDRISCLEGTTYVTIGKEYYMVTADGFLMPTTKEQRPPDPKYFPQAQK